MESSEGSVSRRVRFAAPLFLLLLAAIPFLPALIRGEILAFRDHADYFYPMRFFTAQELASGRIPFWNPFNGFGEPWLANPQTNVFYPPAWLFLVLPFAAAYVAYLIFHLALLGIGAQRLLKRFASQEGALVGAIAIMLSGPTLSLLDVQNNLATVAWLPWLLDAVAVDERRSAARVVRQTILVALMFLAAEPLFFVLALLVAVAAALVVTGTRGVVQFLVAGVLAALVVAPQLVPFAMMLAGSDRSRGLAPEIALRHSAAFTDWLALVVPQWSGRTLLLPLSQHFIVSFFVSASVVALALLALREFRRSRVIRMSVVALCAIAVLAAGATSPISRWLYLALHLDVSRYPSRLVALAVIPLGILAAVGFDSLRVASVRARVVAVLVVTASSGLAALFYRSAVSHVVVPTVISAIVAGGVIAFGRHARVPALFVAVVIAIELLLSSGRLFSTIRPDALTASWIPKVSREQRIARLLDRSPESATFDLSARRRWMMGYLNLVTRHLDLSTPAPVVDDATQKRVDRALSGVEPAWSNRAAVGTVLSTRDLTPGLERAGGSGELIVHRNRRAGALAFADAGARVSRFHLDSNGVSFDVEVDRATQVTLTQRAVEGWSATVDGGGVAVSASTDGFVQLPVAAGRHRVEFSYSPPYFRTATALSLTSMLMILVVTFTSSRGRPTRPSPASST